MGFRKRYGEGRETRSSHSWPYKTCQVRNFGVAGNLHELISLPDPLKDYSPSASNNAARDEIPVIRSAELHSPNLLEPGKELVDDLERSIRAETEDGNRVSPFISNVCANVTI